MPIGDNDGNKYTGHKADETELTENTVLSVFDKLMLDMDNHRVPPTGRLLYVTNEVLYMLKNAQKIERSFSVQTGQNVIDRRVNRLDEVTVIPVPAILMKTVYEFTEGWKAAESADQINMAIIHPDAVITPVSYEFSKLDPPSALSEGKYIYYEESFEDVFILNKKADAIQFNITKHSD